MWKWLYLPDEILVRLSIDPSLLAYLASLLLLLMAWALFLLVVWASVRKLSRRWQRRGNSEKEKLFRETIFHLMTSSALATMPESFLKTKTDRGFFRRLLLQQIKFWRGPEQERLVEFYKQLGFLENDLKLLHSKKWWQRLESAIRLESLLLDELGPYFVERLEDENDLVALVAMRALRKTKSREVFTRTMDSLSRRAPARRDVFVEVVKTMAENQPDWVLNYLHESYDPFIASICIKVLGDLKYEPARESILELTKSASDEVALESIRALGMMNCTPETEKSVRELLKHESDNVREVAITTLLQWGKLEGSLINENISGRRALYTQLVLGELE